MEHEIENHEPCVWCYKTRGCRCKLCSRANNAYEYERSHIRRRPDTDWDNPKVPADRAQNHLRFLAAHGIGTNAVHRATGLHTTTITRIRDGRRTKISKKTEQTIIAQALGMYDIKPADATRARRFAEKKNITTYKLGN